MYAHNFPHIRECIHMYIYHMRVCVRMCVYIQACKNAGVGAEKAWRLAVQQENADSARYARMMLLFFGHYLNAHRNQEDVQFQQAQEHIFGLHKLVKQFEPSFVLDPLPLPPSSPFPFLLSPPTPPQRPVEEDVPLLQSPPPLTLPTPLPTTEHKAGGDPMHAMADSVTTAHACRSSGITTEERIATLCRRQWGRDTQEMNTCIRALSQRVGARLEEGTS